MDVLKLSTEWAKAEVFSAKVVLLISILFSIAAISFWLLGKTVMAKTFVWPMVAAGVILIVVSAGLYFANKPRVTQFQTAYSLDAKAFVQAETVRTAKSQNDFVLVFKVLPLIIIAAALLILFANKPLGRAIGITTIALMTLLMFIDSNTAARNAAYHQQLLDETK
jgi:ABC-2 type transport system permease protein